LAGDGYGYCPEFLRKITNDYAGYYHGTQYRKNAMVPSSIIVIIYRRIQNEPSKKTETPYY
jgi:hypothetical protein